MRYNKMALYKFLEVEKLKCYEVGKTEVLIGLCYRTLGLFFHDNNFCFTNSMFSRTSVMVV